MKYKFESIEKVPYIDYDGTIAWHGTIVELASGSRILYTFYVTNKSNMPDHISFLTHDSTEPIDLLPCAAVLEFLENIENASALDLLAFFYKYDKARIKGGEKRQRENAVPA
ncbi:hypothetical protein ACQKMD_16640 [Viridibacillus sp. NPDC096237]|uniref:hypothetical protein n=1 Tax=Viridibacillus sp. NPDC096237 TaxID=3390721 RepID=UPI003D011335